MKFVRDCDISCRLQENMTGKTRSSSQSLANQYELINDNAVILCVMRPLYYTTLLLQQVK